jgi:hypothetical protein
MEGFMKRTCETCRHFHKELSNMECRAKMPTPVIVPVSGGQFRVLGIFPAVTPTTWCAEHAPKLNS